MIDFLRTNCQKLQFNLIEKENVIFEVIDNLGLEVGAFYPLNSLSDFELQIQKIISEQPHFRNILFADDTSAVLFQNQMLLPQARLISKKATQEIVHNFLHFDGSEGFILRKTLDNFIRHKKIIFERLHGILQILGNEKKRIEFPQFIAFEELKPLPNFVRAKQDFVEICREAINPQVNAFEIRDLLIQHLLFGKIFTVFFENIFKNNHLYQILENTTNTFESHISQIFVLEITQLEEALRQLIQSQNNHIDVLHLFEKVLQQLDNQLFAKTDTQNSAEKKPEINFIFKSIDALLQKNHQKHLLDDTAILDLNIGKDSFLMEFIRYSPKKISLDKANKYLFVSEKNLLKHYDLFLELAKVLQTPTNKKVCFENIAWYDLLNNKPHNAFKQGLLFGSKNSNTEKIAFQTQQNFDVMIGDLSDLAAENLNYPEIDALLKNMFGNEIAKNKIIFSALRYIFWAGQRLLKGILVLKLSQDLLQSPTWSIISKTLEKQYKEVYLVDFEEYSWIFLVK